MIDERDISNLFHGALETQPSAGAFQRLQTQIENVPRAAQRRRGRRIVMTRNRLVLLAAAAIALVLMSVLVGTRIYNNFTQSVPAGHAGIDQLKVAQLLARTFQFKQLAATDPCPANGPNTQGLSGGGPVFLGANGAEFDTNWGHYFSNFIITPPGLAGPIVVRAHDLVSGRPLRFLAPYGAGLILGTDAVHGKSVNQYAYMALDTDHSPNAKYNFPTPFVKWSVVGGWPHTATGFCVGIQIDGPTFTELIHDSVSMS